MYFFTAHGADIIYSRGAGYFYRGTFGDEGYLHRVAGDVFIDVYLLGNRALYVFPVDLPDRGGSGNAGGARGSEFGGKRVAGV